MTLATGGDTTAIATVAAAQVGALAKKRRLINVTVVQPESQAVNKRAKTSPIKRH